MTELDPDDRRRIEELLLFYADAGVDDALLEAAPNRFVAPVEIAVAAAPSPPAAPAERTLPAAARPMPAAVVPDGTQAALARERAAAAETLDALRAEMERFEGCNLKHTAKNLVFADGNPQAALMLVGEAPGREEDLEGLPFIGQSGQLLDRMLAAIGHDRRSVYIANVIPWRPPGNRTPTPQETEICRPFIERQIALVKPRILVTLGNPSTKLLLNATDGILRTRGGWRSHVTADGVSIPAMPTLHPAYLLRNPSHKKLAWRDLLEVKSKMAALSAEPAEL